MWSIVGHWSYSGDPAASTKDAVRFLVGDVDDREPLCGDEEIQYAITQGTTVTIAAAIVCESLAARFAREADTTINPPGGVSHTINYSQRASTYRLLAQQFRTGPGSIAYSGDGAMPYCGGISIADKDTRTADTDRVKTQFVTGMHSHPEAKSDPEWQDLDR